MAAETYQERQPFPHIGITTGVARFLVGKRFYNPQLDVTSPVILRAATEAARNPPPFIDFMPINAISNDQRSSQKTLVEWTQEMSTYFDEIAQKGSADLKKLLKDRFRIDLTEQNPARKQEQIGSIWQRYLKDGSHAEAFLHTLLEDLISSPEGTSSEMVRRIETIKPLLGIFGQSETQILLADANLAQVLLLSDIHVSAQNREQVVQAFSQPFVSPIQRRAYELLWEKVQSEVVGQVINQPTKPNSPSDEGSHVHPSSRRARRSRQQPSTQDQPVIPMGPVKTEGKKEVSLPKQLPENLLLVTPTSQKTGKLIYAEAIMKNPEKTEQTSVRTLVAPIANGEGFFLAAINGHKEGKEYSEEVAEEIQKSLTLATSAFGRKLPSLAEGIQAMIRALSGALPFMTSLQKKAQSEGMQDVSGIGASIALGLVCRNEKGEKVVVSLSVGDSGLFVYRPDIKKAEQLTIDHTKARQEYQQGHIESSNIFTHESTQELTRSLTGDDMAYAVSEFRRLSQSQWTDTSDVIAIHPYLANSLYLAVTKGVTHNIPPDFLSEDLGESFHNVHKKKDADMGVYLRHLVEHLYEKMAHQQDYLYHGKPYVRRDSLGIAGVYAS